MPSLQAGMFVKLGLTAAVVVVVLIASSVLRAVASAAFRHRKSDRPRFWTTQAIHIATLVAVVAGVLLVWSDDTGRLATVAGWMGAGLAIALQRVVTAFAGYVIILRGNIFTIGDRITLGEVRGDVVALGFMQTTIMEMGQAPGEQSDKPSMWVRGRQYSGRIVRVTNDKIFETPVYNYTRDFPYIWDEIMVPVRYADDRHVVERILLEVAHRHTDQIAQQGAAALATIGDKYFVRDDTDTEPRVYVRFTDNWVELSLRFMARDRGVRGLKDAMSRDILDALAAAKIGIASGTYAIVEVPPIKIEPIA